MEIKVNSSELLKRLEQTSKVIALKSTIQILSDVLIEVRNNTMLLTASDSEVWLSEKCPAKHDSDFSFCVNAKTFIETVRNIVDMELTLNLDVEHKSLTCSYGSGEFCMPYEDSSQYPSADFDSNEMSYVIVDGGVVANAIELVSYATAVNNVVQPIVNGIHFDFTQNSMTTVATDVSRVARFTAKDVTLNGREYTKFTIPKKPANILVNILKVFEGDIKILFNANSVFINNTDFKLSARLLEFNYPNYNSVIPSSSPIVITIDKGLLLQAVKRVLPMSNDFSNAILFSFSEGRVLLYADDITDGISASESVECDCETSLEIKLNGSKVIDALRNIDDDNVVIELTNNMRPAVIFPAFNMSRNEYVSVISPIK